MAQRTILKGAVYREWKKLNNSMTILCNRVRMLKRSIWSRVKPISTAANADLQATRRFASQWAGAKPAGVVGRQSNAPFPDGRN